MDWTIGKIGICVIHQVLKTDQHPCILCNTIQKSRWQTIRNLIQRLRKTLRYWGTQVGRQSYQQVRGVKLKTTDVSTGSRSGIENWFGSPRVGRSEPIMGSKIFEHRLMLKSYHRGIRTKEAPNKWHKVHSQVIELLKCCGPQNWPVTRPANLCYS